MIRVIRLSESKMNQHQMALDRSPRSWADDYDENCIGEMLTQHYGSLSQDADASGSDSDNDDAETTEQDDSKPSASEQSLRSEGERSAELSTFKDAEDEDEFSCLDLDADSLRNSALKRKRQSLESSRSSISSNEAAGGMLPMFATEQDKKVKPRSLFDKVTNHTAKKESSKLKRRKRQSSSSSSSHAMTLTQHFRKRIPESTDSGHVCSTTGKRLVKWENAGPMVEVKISKQIRPVSMKPGDCWKTEDKKLTGAGICLVQIGAIHIFDHHYVAEVRNAWMRIENTFIRDEAAEVKGRLGCGWVRVKSHDKLPATVRLSKFTERVPSADIPGASLCYSVEANLSASSYFYEYASPPKTNRSGQGKLCALDLFAGAGGTSIGLTKAGIDVKYKVEWNKVASDTLNMNFNTTVFVEDIAKFIESCKTRRAAVYPPRGSIQYIHGSPPCQGFSSVNTSGGVNDLQNNECTLTFLEAIRYFQPMFVSMENVPGVGREKNIKYLLKIVSSLLQLGYQVRTTKTSASLYGDPQDRMRLIVLASKRGYKLPQLIATHGVKNKPRAVTAGDALGDLEDVEPVLDSMGGLAPLRNGRHVLYHYKEDFTGAYDKRYILNRDLPAKTVTKGNTMKHYKHDRPVTVRERARLQGFPDGHKFAGSKPQDMRDQIGNAVPVGLATAIGRAIVESYNYGYHES